MHGPDFVAVLNICVRAWPGDCSGTKFVYLRRAAALLEMGLCNWALQKVASRGYLPMSTPDLVRASVLEKCGFQPRAENTQVSPLPWPLPPNVLWFNNALLPLAY